MSLFAQIDENGKLTLVNHLGIDLGSTPEQILSRSTTSASKMKMFSTTAATPTITITSPACATSMPTPRALQRRPGPPV
jgi:hypothetical protein